MSELVACKTYTYGISSSELSNDTALIQPYETISSLDKDIEYYQNNMNHSLLRDEIKQFILIRGINVDQANKFEIIVDLNSSHLIQSLGFEVSNVTRFVENYKLVKIERFKNNAFEQVIYRDSDNQDQMSLYFSCITNQLRIVLAHQPLQTDEDTDDELSMACLEDLVSSLQRIQIKAFPCIHQQNAQNIIPLMNLSFQFRKFEYEEEYQETQFMLGLSLMAGRKYVQACDMFRSIQRALVEPYQFQKLAQIEILIAECCNQHGLMHEKLLALKRASQLCQGIQVNCIVFSPSNPQCQDLIFSHLTEEESYSYIISNCTPLFQFLLDNMNDQVEHVRMSILKAIEFILDMIGCSLNEEFIGLLGRIIQTYPHATCKSELQQTSQFFTVGQPDEFKVNQNMKNLYNHLLESYLTVISSMSSQILIRLFYEIVSQYLFEDSASDLKIYLLKIGDKIIQICSADIILQTNFLTNLTLSTHNQKLKETVRLAYQNLWCSVKSKILSNYMNKNLKTVVVWVCDKLNDIKSIDHDQDLDDTKSQNLSLILDLLKMICKRVSRLWDAKQENTGSDCEDDEDDDLDMGIISGLVKNQTTPHAVLEMYKVLQPLMLWMNYTMKKSDRLNLFQQIWDVICDIIQILPAEFSLNTCTLSQPLLQQVYDFMDTNTPPQPMIKFIEILLKKVREPTHDFKVFLTQFLDMYAKTLPHNLYEESFQVYELLLTLCRDFLTESNISNTIEALIDKYTMRSKVHKVLTMQFLKICLDDQNRMEPDEVKDQKFFHNSFERITEKLSLFLQFVQLFRGDEESHFYLYQNLVCEQQFRRILLGMLSFGNNPSLFSFMFSKFMEIMEITTQLCLKYKQSGYFQQQEENQSVGAINPSIALRRGNGEPVRDIDSNGESSPNSSTVPQQYHDEEQEDYMYSSQGSSAAAGGYVYQEEQIDHDYILNHSRLVLAQILLEGVQLGMEHPDDAYIRFHNLILLQNLFYNMLPTGAKPKEVGNQQRQVIEFDQIDLYGPLTHGHFLQMDYRDPMYLLMRMQVSLRVWPYVVKGLQSPWSNIRSNSYELVCSMVKQPMSSLPRSSQKSLLNNLLPLLNQLLNSKESESKAGGLNILGSFCGLGNEEKSIQDRDFTSNSEHVSVVIWQRVFQLQQDWDCTIREASTVLIQLSSPRDSVTHFNKVNKEKLQLKIQSLLGKFNIKDTFNAILKENSFSDNNSQSNILSSSESLESNINERDDDESQGINWYMDNFNDQQIREIISSKFRYYHQSVFQIEYRPPPKHLWIEKSQLLDANSNLPSTRKEATMSSMAGSLNADNEEVFSDIVEDNIISKINKDENVTGPKEDSEYLIFERHFDKPTNPSTTPTQSSVPKVNISSVSAKDEDDEDELGIIDLDEDDDNIDIDDDSLPVLKNTYQSKKRPNNSKSVAIGSKTKCENQMKDSGKLKEDDGRVEYEPPKVRKNPRKERPQNNRWKGNQNTGQIKNKEQFLTKKDDMLSSEDSDVEYLFKQGEIDRIDELDQLDIPSSHMMHSSDPTMPNSTSLPSLLAKDPKSVGADFRVDLRQLVKVEEDEEDKESKDSFDSAHAYASSHASGGGGGGGASVEESKPSLISDKAMKRQNSANAPLLKHNFKQVYSHKRGMSSNGTKKKKVQNQSQGSQNWMSKSYKSPVFKSINLDDAFKSGAAPISGSRNYATTIYPSASGSQGKRKVSTNRKSFQTISKSLDESSSIQSSLKKKNLSIGDSVKCAWVNVPNTNQNPFEKINESFSSAGGPPSIDSSSAEVSESGGIRNVTESLIATKGHMFPLDFYPKDTKHQQQVGQSKK